MKIELENNMARKTLNNCTTIGITIGRSRRYVVLMN